MYNLNMTIMTVNTDIYSLVFVVSGVGGGRVLEVSHMKVAGSLVPQEKFTVLVTMETLNKVELNST